MFFKKKGIKAEKIKFLRKAINSRKELENIVKESKNNHQKREYFKRIVYKMATQEIPSIDIIPRLRDNQFLNTCHQTFIPFVEKYIQLIKLNEYQKALNLNNVYSATYLKD